MYTIYRHYEGQEEIIDHADSISQIFGACAIYVDDEDLISLFVENENGVTIVNFFGKAWGRN